MVEKELIILLQIVIRLVGIIMFFIIVPGIFAARVIPSSVFFHFCFSSISPGMIRLFFSCECDQFDRRIFGEISPLQIVRVEIDGGTVNISVRTDVGKSGIECPVIVQQSGSHFYSFLVGVERTIGTVELRHYGFIDAAFGLHIDTGSEGTGAVGRCSCATLHLHILYGRREVGHIYPEQVVAFGIVHRDAVYSDIDTRAVSASYTKSRIADARSRIRCGQRGRSHAQQVGNILPEVHFFKFGFAYIGKCYGSFCCSTCGYYLHFLQVDYFQTILCTRLCMDREACAQ